MRAIQATLWSATTKHSSDNTQMWLGGDVRMNNDQGQGYDRGFRRWPTITERTAPCRGRSAEQEQLRKNMCGTSWLASAAHASVGATGIEQRPERQDTLAAVTPPALAETLQPLGHEHPIPAFDRTRADRIACIGELAVVHAFSVVAKIPLIGVFPLWPHNGNRMVMGTFDQLDRGWLIEFVEHRIGDRRVIRLISKWLGRVVGGWLRYYAVPTSFRSLNRFVLRLMRMWLRALRQRSQKDRFTWNRVGRLAAAFWPPLRILHPWPTTRFAVKTRGRSRMV